MQRVCVCVCVCVCVGLKGRAAVCHSQHVWGFVCRGGQLFLSTACGGCAGDSDRAAPESSAVTSVGLARTVYIRRIRPYIWCFCLQQPVGVRRGKAAPESSAVTSVGLARTVYVHRI